MLLSLLLAAGGLLAALNLKRDLFPDLALPSVQVLIQSAGRDADELETVIALPTEQALQGLPDVRRVVSIVQPGIVQVVVAFEPGADPFRSRLQVAERIASVSGSFPEGTDAPLLTSAAGRLQEIQELVLEGPVDRSDEAARHRGAGGGAAPPVGARHRPRRAARRRGAPAPGGDHPRAHAPPRRHARAGRRLRSKAASATAAPAFSKCATSSPSSPTPASPPAPKRRAASRSTPSTDWSRSARSPRCAKRPAFRMGLARYQGFEVVSMRVVKQPSAETLAVARAVRDLVPDLQRALPEGMTLTLFYDQGDLVRHALGGVGQALAIGAFFVAAVLIVLLGNLRAASIVLVLLPLAILGSAIPLFALGEGWNAMTLGGLAIAVGLLVDAGVIMVENLAHRVASRSHARRAAGSSPPRPPRWRRRS